MVEITSDHIDTLEKLSNLLSKESVININGDIILESNSHKKDVQKLRSTPGANSWKTAVKKRDKVCQCCGTSTEQLQVHHVMPLSVYPDFATDVNNGIVLCQKCHTQYHKEWKDSEGPATLTKFLREHGRFL